MSLKLLIATCCLLAVVQARPPKLPSTTCAISCVSRNFWTGYEVGNVYTYKFEQKVELSSDLSSSQASRLQVSGLAKVEVHSDCEMALTVEVKDAKVGEIDNVDSLSPREPPAKVLEALRIPLRFSFENGQVVQLCPNADETRASLNLKRGLLSQLQVSAEQRGQAHQLEERDILGDCWTEYTPEGPNTLLKTKDLSKCKLNYQAYPLSGVKSFDDEKIQSRQPITKGSLACRIEIDSERDIVKETTCTEEQIQSADHESDSAKEKIRTSTRLSLQSETSGLANALQEVAKRTDLRHAHKTSSQCHSTSAWAEEDLFHSANECVERNHGAKTSAEYKAQAKKTLEELCRDTKSHGMNRDTPKKFADLIKYMRGITEQEHFNQLYKWVREGFCRENPLIKAIIRSAIPTVGTKQSASLILDQLSKSEVMTADRENWLVNGIALMQHPTPEILPEFLKLVRNNRDDAMLSVSRDEPLALSAVVHKICQEMPNCETEPKVKAVIDYFSESLGSSCERFSTDADNVFVALLSIGNMGRVAGGATTLVRCATNQRLQTVHRVFALHSLRRFANISMDAQSQLTELMLNSELDSELRIAAYQALSRHSFDKTSHLYDAVQRLLDDAEGDRQVQMFVYTHLQSLRGETARQMAPVLASAKTIAELKKLSRTQYSSNLRTAYFSNALGAGGEAEVPIVFSAQSAIPRYIGLNLTVNVPSQGQSINLMEIGLRMQGLERIVEQHIASKFGRREASTPEQSSELTSEQSRLQQTPTEPRIDMLIRRYGAEVSHSDLSGGILESMSTVASKADYSYLSKLLSAVPSADKAGTSAGTLAESTLSIPTIAGLPILVKKEIHYITNLRVDKKFKVASGSSADATLDVKPAAAVLMAHTVAVDAIFERAGIRSSTSFLTSTGLRISLKSKLDDSADRQFSFKVEPLVKKQNVADVKTEMNFFQHTAGKVHTEKPLAPQQTSVKSEKCVEGFFQKYAGHKICYKTENLPSCKKTLRSFCQCPGSYQLFLEKNEDFGAYEVSFNMKNQEKIQQLQVLVGDKKSKDRLLKFNIQSVSEGDRANYKLELQNPIFPISIDSNFTKAAEGYKVYSEAKAGSVEYVASGSVKSQPETGLKIDGEIYPKDKTTQAVKVSLEHKFNGITALLLPVATTKLQATMHTGNQLELEYNLSQEKSNFLWKMSSEYKTSKGETTAMRYRVQYNKKFEENKESSNVFLYDIEVQNPKGMDLAHSLHAKVLRQTEADGKQTSASVSHKLQYGTEKKRSPLDFEARVSMKEAIDSELFEASGDGEFTFFRNGEPVTAKLEKLKIQMGEAADTTDGFDKQYKYAINYGIKFEEKSANYEAELRHLEWKRWSLTQQAVELKAKSQIGAQTYSVQLKHSLNSEKLQTRQLAKIEYDEYVYFHLDNTLRKVEGVNSIKHELILQKAQGNKVEVKCGVAWPEAGILNSDTIVEVNAKKVFGCKQTLRYTKLPQDHQLKHKMTMEMEQSSYTIETDAKMSKQSTMDFKNFMSYQVRLITGRYRTGKSLQLLGNLLRDLSFEQSSKLVGPTLAQQAVFENVISMNNLRMNGVVYKNLLQVTSESKDTINYGLTITKTGKSSDESVDVLTKKGLQIEITAMDQSLKTEVERRLTVDQNKKYTNSLMIASKDTWGWHDVKVEAKRQESKEAVETLLKLEGNVYKRPITSSISISYGTDSRKSQNYVTVLLTTEESKLRINLNKTASPLQLIANASIDGDFGLLPFKTMKAKAEFNMQHGIAFETEAEIEDTRIMKVKLQVAKNTFIADLKTAHPQFQEAGIKIVIETNIPETIKCNTLVKFVGLDKSLQIKKTGTATFSYNTPVYSILFGLTGNLEFEGLEDFVSYKKLDYDLMLKKKPGMEFQFVTSVSSPDHTTSKLPMLFLTSSLNYWPFKTELKYKVNNYKGWEVKYGVRAEVDNKNAFVGVEYNDQEAAATYKIQDASEEVKAIKFSVKCSFCGASELDLVSGQANMTWPVRLSEFEIGMDAQVNSAMLKRITFRFLHRPANKLILASFLWNGKTEKLIDCSYTQTNVAGNVQGDALLHADLRFFLGEMARAKVQANYKYGKDKELNFDLTLANSDRKAFQGKIFWLSTPRNFDSIQVPNIDRGFQIKGFNVDAYIVHTSKSDKNSELHVSVNHPSLSNPISGKVELDDGNVKSGMINAFDREIVLRSNPDGGFHVTLKTNSDEAKTISVKWTGKYENQKDMMGKLEIETDGQSNIIEVKIQPQQIVFNYGKSASPNSLKIDYELRDMNTDLTISHETDAENTEFNLLPGFKLPMPSTRYPFKLILSAKNTHRQLTITFESASLGVKSMDYSHDFARFPRSFSTESKLISTEETQIWEVKINVDRDAPSAVAKFQIGKKFEMSFKEPEFQLKLKNVIDLTIQLPKFLTASDDSDKKELSVQLEMPVLKINEPINLKIALQRLPEGRQLNVKYGWGEDDQIVWSLTARKFRLAPKFDIDVEAGLTSKYGLLGDWQIRSVEARMESSLEKLTDTDGYIIAYKDSVKVNGDDLSATIIRLEGANNALPRKGELTVSGKIESTIKFERSNKDKQIKISCTIDKIGDSHNKYSLKLKVSPLKAGAWCPDFKVETECPHREFVVGKQFQETAGESRMKIQFYLNKRQAHGATIIYKAEAPSSGTPKYTIEAQLPTRKIRAVCQPETGDKKFGAMTTFDWDADKSPEKTLGLDARVDFSSDVVAILECKAPFLHNRLRLEGRYESKDAGYTIQLKHMNGESEALKIKADYSYESDAARFTLETTGALESKLALAAQARDDAENSNGRKVDGTLKIQAYSTEKNIKFVYRPMREITVTCDHGASLSVKYTVESRRLHQLVIFASDNEKAAARLKFVLSKPAETFTAKLDFGRGSFSDNSDVSGPNYRPETVLLRVAIKKNSATAFLGKMTVGQKPSPFEATGVPGHLSFFAATTQKTETNMVKFRANWRTPSKDKMESAIASVKSFFNNYLTATSPALSGTFEHLTAIRRSAASGVDSSWLTEEINSLASNDIDQLTRYFEQCLTDNEFYLRYIVNGAYAVSSIAKRCFDEAAKAAVNLKETLEELQIYESATETAQNALNAVVELINQIPIKSALEAIAEYADTVKSFVDYLYIKADENVSDFFEWLSAVASNPTGAKTLSKLLEQAGDYLDSVFPVTGVAKDTIAQVWSRARSIVAASLTGMKSLAVDDLLPLAVNHLEDVKAVKDMYDNLMLEMRIWYDSDATSTERDALSRISQLLSYIYSEETLNNLRYISEGFSLIVNGDIAAGLKHLNGKSMYTVWRPNCDNACQRGDTFAAVEGEFYTPIYTPDWTAVNAPSIVLKRISQKLYRDGLPTDFLMSAILGSTVDTTAWNPIIRLLAIRHRTAVLAGDNHLITFDGLALTHQRPCSYLIARDFLRGDFSVVQEYKKSPTDDRQVRDLLRVRFGDVRISVERDGAVRMNDRTERLPMKKSMKTGRSVEASRAGDVLTVRFNGNLRDALVLRCSFVADSCVVSVHPLYKGRVRGLAGSNDDRRENDIQGGEVSEHVKFWTAGECQAEGSASASVSSESGSDISASTDCFSLFRKPDSPLAACFDAVDPRPFQTVCQRQERSGRDACEAARQYVERCNSEGLKMRLPAKCVACRQEGEAQTIKSGQLVTDRATLQKRIQVVFLLENSACGLEAIGSGASRIQNLAGLIDRLKAANSNVKSIEFGLAHYGGSDSAPLTSIPMKAESGNRFGSLTDLTSALTRLQLSASADDESSASVEVLRAIADLPAQYQWRPLAQKHLVIVSCKPCTASSWSYASLFAQAQKSVKDQVYVHTISKTAIRSASGSERMSPDFAGYDAESYHLTDRSSSPMDKLGADTTRRFATECAAELATDSENSAKGSVWSLTEFADSASSVGHLMVAKQFQRHLDTPRCQRCSCGQQQPKCRVVKCEN